MLLQGVRVLLLVTVVAEHDRGSGDAYLAGRSVFELVTGPGLHDLVVHVRERDPDRTLLEPVGGREAGCRDAFRRPVPLSDLHRGVVFVQVAVHLPLQLHRQAVSSGEDPFEERQVRLLHLGHADQRLEQGGDSRDVVAPVLQHQLDVAVGRETGHQDAVPSLAEGGVDRDPEAEPVEYRHHGQHPVSRPVSRIDADDLLGQGVEVVAAQAYALADSRGPSRIEDDGRSMGIGIVPVRSGVRSSGFQEVVPQDDVRLRRDLLVLPPLGHVVAEADDRSDLVLDGGDEELVQRDLLPDVLELPVELIEGHHQLRFGFRDEVLDLLLAGERVDHVRHRSDHVHGVEHRHALGAVRKGDGDLVSFGDAVGAQDPGAFPDLLQKAGVARPPAEEYVGAEIRVLLRGPLDHGGHGAVRVF